MEGSTLGRFGDGGSTWPSRVSIKAPSERTNKDEVEATHMGGRMSWPQIRQSDEYRGRWVALDNCRYDARTAEPVEGTIIDADDDLVELCTRIRQSESKHCAILFCEVADETPPPSSTQRRAAYSPTTH